MALLYTLHIVSCRTQIADNGTIGMTVHLFLKFNVVHSLYYGKITSMVICSNNVVPIFVIALDTDAESVVVCPPEPELLGQQEEESPVVMVSAF